MPSVNLHIRAPNVPRTLPTNQRNGHERNPLPPLLQTPLGLALLEIQGSLNLPTPLSTTSASVSARAPNPPIAEITVLDKSLAYAGASTQDAQRDAAGGEEGQPNRDTHADTGYSAAVEASQTSQMDLPTAQTQIGRLVFPLLATAAAEDAEVKEGAVPAWAKKAHLYVGENQRLTGEVRKLSKPLGVVARRETADGGELEVLEVLRWKVFFGGRPEFV